MAGVDSEHRLSPYATPSATRAVLERHGLYTKYALGQNFLVNDDVVRKILDLADVGNSDCILEVGPGIGTLTAALLQRARCVASIEIDADLATVLADTLAPWADRFSLLGMDALAVAREDLEALQVALPVLPNKLVSNLPYAVAATVVLDYLQRFDFLESETVMVQKEVANRMMARPGTKEYGAYTVKLSLYAEPRGRFSVAPGNFFPPPRVESAVIRLDRIRLTGDDGRPLAERDRAAACTMADAAFATRRKTLANSCKTYFAGRPAVQEVLPSIFEAAAVDPRSRGERLDRDDFVRLGQAFARCAADGEAC